MLLIGQPGEQALLLVRINKSSPLCDTLILTDQRILLLHSRQVLRNASVHPWERGTTTRVTVRKKFLSQALVIEDTATGEDLMVGGLHPNSLKWLQQITAHDSLFQL